MRRSRAVCPMHHRTAGPNAGDHSAATAGLRYCCTAQMRCGQAEKPGQVSHGRVSRALPKIVICDNFITYHSMSRESSCINLVHVHLPDMCSDHFDSHILRLPKWDMKFF